MIVRASVVLVVVAFWTTSVAAQGMGPQGPGLLQGPPPVSAAPKDALKEPEDQMRAKGLTACAVGDRVLASHEGLWIPAQVIAVDLAAQYPCKVHLLGRPPSLDSSFAAWMLRPEAASR